MNEVFTSITFTRVFACSQLRHAKRYLNLLFVPFRVSITLEEEIFYKIKVSGVRMNDVFQQKLATFLQMRYPFSFHLSKCFVKLASLPEFL